MGVSPGGKRRSAIVSMSETKVLVIRGYDGKGKMIKNISVPSRTFNPHLPRKSGTATVHSEPGPGIGIRAFRVNDENGMRPSYLRQPDAGRDQSFLVHDGFPHSRE